MKHKYYFILLIILVSGSVHSDLGQIEKEIHSASRNLDVSVNYKSVTESLYEQIRPRVHITKPELTPKEIDSIVRDYVSKKYTPALIHTYKVVYAEFMENHDKFDNCDSLGESTNKEVVLKSLCLVINKSIVEVRYFTNGYAMGWKLTAVFKFRKAQGKYEMFSIDIPKDGTNQEAYVEGV